jgi:hypothetical protein
MKMPSDSTSFMATTSKWQSSTKLEIDQLHEYDTFCDKGIRTTPGDEFKKIQVHLVYVGSLGSDNTSICG